MSMYQVNLKLSNAEIEKRARGLGMNYPSEFKVNTK